MSLQYFALVWPAYVLFSRKKTKVYIGATAKYIVITNIT